MKLADRRQLEMAGYTIDIGEPPTRNLDQLLVPVCTIITIGEIVLGFWSIFG